MYKTIVVVDSEEFLFDCFNLPVITFTEYLQAYPKLNEPKTRIINLCDTAHYLSRGYYCSLLAEARQHRALPSVGTINDLRPDDTSRIDMPQTRTQTTHEPAERVLVFFGTATDNRFSKQARQAFEKFPAPILKISLGENGLAVSRYAFSQLNTHEQALFLEQLKRFTEQVWKTPASKKKHRWDMAILVNPEERHPPSDDKALQRFVKAASKLGIHAELITQKQSAQIAEYDALFIRETTAIDHPTYRLARKAEQEGLVVIDDSTSILRCCNKVFLHDAFSYNKVPSLKTTVVMDDHDATLDQIEATFGYPVVLKMPEGSFSKGVFKVTQRSALKEKLTSLLSETALVLVQEYVYTDYDWRIGVLNGRAIYACRYHMAKNHWQIYNHSAKRFQSGTFQTLPTFEVPSSVLSAAVKASSMIGNGLYGVDIKQKDQHVYVIEVNDNPNIDHKVEDAYLGNELYMVVMSEFARRLEQRGKA